jgi:exodeoxyribonuclease V gamma subunit
MFYLHVANRTENLLRQLAEILENDPQPDFFAAELFVIQSQGMERMVVQSLADQFRCFCNYRFFLPFDFLRFIAEKLHLGVSSKAYERPILTWRLEELLGDLNGGEYSPLQAYLAGDNGERKRFQLAARLANIFDQYQVMRPEMLVHWENGRRVTGQPAESWQMALWHRLLAGPGGNLHRGMLLRRVIDRLGSQEELAGCLPKRISVIGLHTMPTIFLDYLNRLAGHMDVHLLLLSPCRHFWGDVESRRTQLKQMVRYALAVDSTAIDHHPLLASLGRQGRDFQNMLLDQVEIFAETDGYEEPLSEEEYSSATLLRRLQADLLEDRINDEPSPGAAGGDGSIQVVSCHSRLRELQVLKDHLLDLLYHDHDLQLRQIVVMAPDIQEYAPLIPAVFADIQHAIADRGMRRRNSTVAAFLVFLNLFTGRFGWNEVLDLLRQPVVHPQFQLTSADFDQLEQWVIGAGIRWGLSGRQRGEEGLPEFAETSWRAGLERLLMGYAIAGDKPVDGVLPYPEIEGRGALPLGGLCRFLDLIDQARCDFQRARTLTLWSGVLLHYARQLFGDADDQDLVELRAILAEPAEAIGQYHGGEVAFPVIRDWLNLSARESRSSSGFLRGHLTFCSMLPMRSIPFKVVCLLGLSDGLFPNNDRHDTFDLMAGDFRPGDRSPRADDRYQFLEALLAARSHLYLSYVGQSIRTGEPIPPSVVVTEFLELLETSYGVTKLVVSHPLHPFSARYFAARDGQKLFSYNDYFRRTAEALQRGPRPPKGWWQGRIEAALETVHLADLLRFFANPQRFFVTDRLGIRLDFGVEPPDEREPFAPSALDRYLVDRDLLRLGRAGELAGGLAAITAEGRWPLGTPGRLAFSEKCRETERLLERVDTLRLGQPLPGLPVDLMVGNIRLVGNLANLHDHGILLLRTTKLRGRDLLSGWLHQLVAGRLMPPAATYLVTADQTLRFAATSEGPSLERLFTLFAEGCRRPLPLLVEPAWVYARQQASPKARTAPLVKAQAVYLEAIDKGYQPEWTLLYGDSLAQAVLDGEFVELAEELLGWIWRVADVL